MSGIQKDMELKEQNQRTRILSMLQEKYPNYHPIIALADLAMTKDDEGNLVADTRTQLDCHRTILKHVEPELKSVEIKGSMKSDFGTLTVVLAESDEDSKPDESGAPGDASTDNTSFPGA